MLTKINAMKRRLDIFFFEIEDDEYIALGDQFIFYGSILFMVSVAFLTYAAVY